MTNAPQGSLLARLGGADPAVLAKAPGQASRFSQMGLVLLSTAGLAAVSMTFALSDALKVNAWAAIGLGLAWGAIILNLDRLLILTMKPTSGMWAIVGSVLPRIVMAALLGIVVATPLTLRIFDAEIKTQIALDQAQTAKTLGEDRSADPQRAELEDLYTRIGNYENVLAGKVQYSTPLLEQARTDLQTARDDLNAKQAAYDQAYCKYSQELYGRPPGAPDCGASGRAGTGDLTNSAKGALDSASTALTQARDDVAAKEEALTQAQDASKATTGQKLAADQEEANRQLPALRQQRDTIQANLAAQSNSDADVIAGEGLLSKIQALDRLGEASSAAWWSHWAVAGLLFMIELLPVLVKTMTLFGPTSVYDRISEQVDKSVFDDATQQRSADRRRFANEEKKHAAIDDDMNEHEIRLGKQANQRVAEEMEKILDVALQNWSRDVNQTLHTQAPPSTPPPGSAVPPYTFPASPSPNGIGTTSGPGHNGQTRRDRLNLNRWWRAAP